MKKIDELRLIAQCALGDSRQAFGQLVEAYQSQLRRFLMNLTGGDEALTDDLAQETFLKAYVNVRNFKGLSSFATWLYRIAYNESITFLKQQRHMTSIDDEDFVEPANLVADEHFDGDETESLLMQAVSTLPPKQRQVFCMKYFEEQKYEDISELVGTSVGALKASYHIAVEKITSFIKSKE